MPRGDWGIAECLVEQYGFDRLPEEVQEALKGRYRFSVLGWNRGGPRGLTAPPNATIHSVIIHDGVVDEPDGDEKLRVLFHEFAHVYLNHGCPRPDNAEEQAEALADNWLRLWREREAAPI
jgi:hypothetical protein